MHFCINCQNMYYLKIREEDGGNTLNYYCRNCGHEDTTLTAESICVSETQLRRSEQKFTHMINEYTKFDPTLPRINTIKCPNQECVSNGFAGGVDKKHDLTNAAPHLNNPVMDGGNKKGGNNEEDGTSVTVYDGGAQAEGGTQAEGGAGKKTTDAGAEGTTKKKLVLTKNKTAKTLAKEAAESAKEAVQSAKEAETIVKELIAEEDKEEAEEVAAQTKSKKQTVAREKKENEREVIYIRYDDINMKYVYLCVHCDTTWKTDNRT
jgi:DNA-directed RNA polymerase subunit M/transcription elongation factor TFIIS